MRRIDWTVESADTGRAFSGTSLFSCFPAEREFRIHRLYWGRGREFHDVSYQLEKFSLAFDEQLALHPVAMARHRGVIAGDTPIVAYSAQGRNKALTLKAPGVFSRASFPEGDWEGVVVGLENAEQPGVMRGAEPPVFLLENRTGHDLRLAGAVRIAAAAATDALPEQPVALEIPRGKTARFAPSGAFDGYGLWHIDFALRDAAVPTAATVHDTRIARIPENPWSNDLADGFIFGVNGSSERSDWQRQFPPMQRCGIKMVRGGLPGGAVWLRERGMEPLTGAFPETPSADWPEKNTEDDPPESLKKFVVNAERLAAATVGSQRHFMMKNEGDISRRDYPEDYLVLMQRMTHGATKATARVPVFSIIPIDEAWTAPLFRLDRPGQMESFMLNPMETSPLFWSGPEDLSSSVYCRREGDALRLRFVVTDDSHFQEWRGGRIWLGDTAQVAFKLPGEGRFWEFWFALTVGDEPQVWCWQAPAGTDTAAASVRLTATRDETTKTTTYDATIPLATLGLTPEILRDGFRMNVLHTDNDGSGRESHIRAADGMGIDEKNSANFPFVFFK